MVEYYQFHIVQPNNFVSQGLLASQVNLRISFPSFHMFTEPVSPNCPKGAFLHQFATFGRQ